ncbi:hypothetical protein [Streptomyces sp. S.PB5]|uniref:hypothetical protein n=1 Tax=Streptomyces sp. S.PB5 TaxID=3020844 RepID=UPI0025B25C3F|nr:hypothetical protein [Streptomyces sp. S.PB5]MDN3023024.1 hypothetical protein [Streptomyces sp. S.PB5]
MPLFRRAAWPGDHRDEVVAGALVGAVVIVLGYASGIGAPSPSGPGAAAAPPTSPPATTAPPSPAAPSPQDPVGQPPVGNGELPVYGGAGGVGGIGGIGGSGAHAGHGDGSEGHTGHGGSPGDSPTPTPSPSGSETTEPPGGTDGACEDGEVRLVQPLLTGITGTLTGLLATPTATPSPSSSPSPSPCVGLAPVSVPGLLGISASPLPEATP